MSSVLFSVIRYFVRDEQDIMWTDLYYAVHMKRCRFDCCIPIFLECITSDLSELQLGYPNEHRNVRLIKVCLWTTQNGYIMGKRSLPKDAEAQHWIVKSFDEFLTLKCPWRLPKGATINVVHTVWCLAMDVRSIYGTMFYKPVLQPEWWIYKCV